MTATITSNLTLLYDADSATGWSAGTLNTEQQVQGTGCMSAKVSLATSSFVFTLAGATDLTNNHIYSWVMSTTVTALDTFANGGIRIRVEDGSANFGEWYVFGKDTYTGGWKAALVDTTKTFDNKSATAPTLSAITKIGVTFKTTGMSSAINCFWDVARYGTGLTVSAGTSSDPGLFEDIFSADSNSSNAYGVIRKEGGIYFLQGKLKFGSTTAGTATFFKDIGQIVAFEDKVVFPTFYELILQGNATANTEVYFGTKSGTVGISGCIFKAVPPKNMKGAVADDGGSQTNETTAANNDTINDMTLLPASGTIDVNDAYYFGGTNKFNKLQLNIGTAGVGAWVLTWEYWNGSIWASLSGVTDPSNNFKTDGPREISYTAPTDWPTTTVATIVAYWIRARVTTGDAAPTTRPLGTRSKVVENGFTIDALDTNVTKFGFFGCSLFDVGKISTPALNANKEILDCNIERASQLIPNTGKVSGTKFISSPGSAIQMASASHNITSCTFISCSRGVEITIADTFSFNALKFSGNTYDVRNSSGGAVTINASNGANPSTVENTSGSSTTIVNTVTLKVTVKNEAGAAISGAQVGIYKDSDNSQLMNESTIADGTATEDFNYPGTDVPVSVRVRKGTGGATKYFPVASPQTIKSTGLDVTVTLIEDTINNN